ncbi:MAG: flagellar export chaperone FlgN [Candidatus Loosdrechtia sp.]|uniref:flagellar export chaperone FlgN n=1 Tax=Candidatus Loosdrechtia sp. TaxID=3101272 RepID=UPI003A5D5475|nr:MAG: flagellar export chaperone FlgN [Candidatus Jettenia sp. AMX2]
MIVISAGKVNKIRIINNMKHLDATEEIISFLNQKKAYYKKILSLTQDQEKAIKSNNINGLNSIIKEKEGVIGNIRHLDRLNKKTQKEIFTKNEYREDIRISSLLKQLQSLITDIMNHDRKDLNILYVLISTTKTKFDNLSNMQRSQISMRTQTLYTPGYVDVVR